MDMRRLATQRVCRAWRNMITDAPSTKRELFFEQAPRSNVRVKNPLLSEIFPQWFAYGEWANRREIFRPGDLENLAFLSEECNSAFQYDMASWKKMLLAGPILSFTRCANLEFMDGERCDLSTISADTKSRYSHLEGRESPYRQPDPNSYPLPMEEFDRLGIGLGIASGWLFIWDNETNQQSIISQIAGVRMMESTKGQLEEDLRRDGLVTLEKAHQTCTVDWDICFGREYHVDDELQSFWEEIEELEAEMGVTE